MKKKHLRLLVEDADKEVEAFHVNLKNANKLLKEQAPDIIAKYRDERLSAVTIAQELIHERRLTAFKAASMEKAVATKAPEPLLATTDICTNGVEDLILPTPAELAEAVRMSALYTHDAGNITDALAISQPSLNEQVRLTYAYGIIAGMLLSQDRIDEVLKTWPIPANLSNPKYEAANLRHESSAEQIHSADQTIQNLMAKHSPAIPLASTPEQLLTIVAPTSFEMRDAATEAIQHVAVFDRIAKNVVPLIPHIAGNTAEERLCFVRGVLNGMIVSEWRNKAGTFTTNLNTLKPTQGTRLMEHGVINPKS